MTVGLQLKVFLAGRVAIETNGVVSDESRFPGRQGRLLFAYLVAEQGRPVPRDELAEALWGEAPPATWDKALTVIVSKLRSTLADRGIDGRDALTAAFGCYRLVLPEGTWIDVIVATKAAQEAEEALAAGELEQAKAVAALAASLVQQPFLPGENGAWVEEKRRELADVRGRALSALADACLRSGDAPEAAKWAEQSIALEPFRETGYRRLMEAHVAAGNPAEALGVYEQCRRLLAEELGTYPSPETESLYRGLLEAPSTQPRAAAVPEPRLSSATRELVEEKVGGDTVRELGSYRLKDFDQPERFYQLDIDGLPSKFPPPRAEAVTPSRKRRLLLVAGALLAACLAAVTIVVFTGGGSGVGLGPTSLAVVDPKAAKVVDAVDLGFKSNLIAAGEGAIWVVDPEGSILWRIDPRTQEKRSIGISVGAGAVPFGVAAGYGSVWVAVLRGARPVVLQLGPEVGDLRRTIPYGGRGVAPVLAYLQPLAVGAGAVWAIDPTRGGIWRIRTQGGPARKLVEGLSPLSVAADDDAVWVGQTFGVVKIDPLTGRELGSVLTGSPGESETASVAVGFGSVWFTSSSGQKLSKIDPQSVSTAQTFPVGRGPSGVATGEGAVWVANSRDGTISRIGPNGGQEQVVTLGQAPGGIVTAYDAVWSSPGKARS